MFYPPLTLSYLVFKFVSYHCAENVPICNCLASLAFRALSGLVPDYLAGDCQLVALSGRRPLRSVERRVCHVSRQNCTFDDRSFAAASPRTWNKLPFSLRDTGL